MRQMAQGTAPAHMMQFRSTQGMAQFVRDTPQKVVIMATEVGNIYPLSKAAPGKTIVPASPEAVCAYMKQNTLRKLYVSLRDGIHEITVTRTLGRVRAFPSGVCSALYKISHSRSCRHFADHSVGKRPTSLPQQFSVS